MNILYAFQGTGNGHAERANVLIPLFEKFGNVDVIVSGSNYQVPINHSIKHKYNGLTFKYNAKGSIDISSTIRSTEYLKYVKDLNSCAIDNYDLIINDFEPVTSWKATLKNKPAISLGHQAAFVYNETPRPRIIDPLAEIILRYYAPSKYHFGVHLKSYHPNIFTPIIKNSVRRLNPTKQNHVTVYVPWYDSQYLKGFFSKFPDYNWHIFSPGITERKFEDNIILMPISSEGYSESLATCTGLITGGGFEGPTEALFLGKKLLLLPLKLQYEQSCNVLAFQEFGATVVNQVNSDFEDILSEWIMSTMPERILFQDNAKSVVDSVMEFAQNEIL